MSFHDDLDSDDYIINYTEHPNPQEASTSPDGYPISPEILPDMLILSSPPEIPVAPEKNPALPEPPILPMLPYRPLTTTENKTPSAKRKEKDKDKPPTPKPVVAKICSHCNGPRTSAGLGNHPKTGKPLCNACKCYIRDFGVDRPAHLIQKYVRRKHKVERQATKKCSAPLCKRKNGIRASHNFKIHPVTKRILCVSCYKMLKNNMEM